MTIELFHSYLYAIITILHKTKFLNHVYNVVIKSLKYILQLTSYQNVTINTFDSIHGITQRETLSPVHTVQLLLSVIW